MPEDASAILRFWFGSPRLELGAAAKRWFTKDPGFDREIAEQFGGLLERGKKGELDAWATGPSAAQGTLALIVLLDQMSRNIHRGTAEAFAADGRALAFCLGGIHAGQEKELSFAERYMFLMPLMHAEDRALQRQAVERFATLVREAEQAGVSDGLLATLRSAHEYAVKHAEIVERFGRFPHRNALLGRASTPEELEFLAQPGSSF